MNKSLLLHLLFGISALLIYSTLNAQNDSSPYMLTSKAETQKRIDDYLQLFKLGYTEKEIFEDLGNVNFLIENYDTAVFWYEKLLDITGQGELNSNYYDRYQFAMQKAGLKEGNAKLKEKDWMAMIREDYQLNTGNSNTISNPSSTELAVLAGLPSITDDSYSDPADHILAYDPPMAITNNGNTAFFAWAIKQKPLYGIFSKEQTVYKIFKATKRNGSWKQVTQVAVCPKYASALHPTVSPDGKRLFFASNMPGTFGAYDIYVSDIGNDGSISSPKNLGEKVNTAKNELYPNVVENAMLTFASDGRKGQGGLDLYAAKIGRSSLSLAVNLGNPLNSTRNDYALLINPDKNRGYVMSNRSGAQKAVQQIAFTYNEGDGKAETVFAEDQFMEILNSEIKTGYSNTVFDDQEP
ncbi:MAG: PD40 domain-containing protein [Bacteroidia bacterium]|nr:PD40 domain-containing protein [Bacteroidia bacterium]